MSEITNVAAHQYVVSWSGDVHAQDRGLLCAIEAMHATREASTVVPCYAQINRTKPKRVIVNEPRGVNPRRGYHQAYYRRRMAGKV